jgi:hypothetical protein
VAYSVVETSDGGYALAGYTSSSSPYGDLYLVKTFADGTMAWNRTYGGKSHGWAHSLIQTPDGGYAIAGEIGLYGSSNSDFWLVKTDSAGNMQWNKTYGGTDNDIAYSLVQTVDSGYALAGLNLLVKTDSAGSMQWNKTYGGALGERAYSLVQTSDGGYALAGTIYIILNDYTYADFWLAKTDSAGNMQWNKAYGAVGEDEVASSIVQTVDGGYALAGTKYFDYNPVDFWLVKTDSTGNMQWNRAYGGALGERANSLIQTVDGGYAIAGDAYSFGSGSQVYLVKTDGMGLMDLEFGVTITNIAADSLTMYRGKIDPYYNYIRVRIYVVKENP